MEELKKYKDKFPGVKMNAVYDVIEKTLESNVKRKDIIEEVADKYNEQIWINSLCHKHLVSFTPSHNNATAIIKS